MGTTIDMDHQGDGVRPGNSQLPTAEPASEPQSSPRTPEASNHNVVLQTASREMAQYKSHPIRRAARDPQDFYSSSSESLICNLIEQVVQTEGPVHLEVVGRRVASHWGLTQLGRTIRDRIETLARRANVKRVSSGRKVFLWPMELDPAQYRSFRRPGMHSEDQRDIDEMPPEELVAAAMYVLEQQISLPLADLVRQTALLLGFQRAGRTIQRVLGAAIQTATEKDVIVRDENGRVRLPQG